MDIKCPICTEPWDIDELHDVPDATFEQAYRQFKYRGCGVTFGTRPCQPSADPNAQIIAELTDLLGDDVDGLAATLEDFGL